jgi:Bacterial Ig-like domain (group 3)/Putative Ig domain
LSLTATNGVSPDATQSFTLTVDQAPAITSDDATTFTVGSAGTFSITTSGFPNASLSETGALPGGVTFLDNGDGTATLSGTPAAGTVGVFTVTLTASNGVAPDASQDFILTVATANSATTVSGSPSLSVYGQLLTFSAHVSASVSGIVPSGIVTFQEDNTVLDRATLGPSGNATFSTNTLAVGSHTITASYSGDANFNPSTSTSMGQTVNPAPSIVTAQPSTSATSVGEPITFTATITAPPGTGTPTGTVTFMDGNTVLGRAPVNPVGPASLTESSPSGVAPTNTPLGTGSLDEVGYATLTVPSLPAGAHSITAVYGGDATHAPSTTAVADVVIVAPTPTNDHGPTVVGLARYGYHAQPTYLLVYFDGPLNESSAQRASNYKVAGPIKDPGTHKPIIVTSAAYNPATNTVTLAFNRRFNLHYHYRLTIKGTAPSGITNPSSVPLNAAGATQPGSNYVVRFGPKILAGSASQRTSLGHTRFSFQGKGTTTRSDAAVHHPVSKDVMLSHRRRPKP